MLALAGYPLGLRFRFLDPSPEAPVGRIAQRVTADFDDQAALEKFANGLELVTYEFENVPVAATPKSKIAGRRRSRHWFAGGAEDVSLRLRRQRPVDAANRCRCREAKNRNCRRFRKRSEHERDTRLTGLGPVHPGAPYFFYAGTFHSGRSRA